jgi:hypothetical protein
MRSFILVMLLLLQPALALHSQSAIPKHLRIAKSFVGTRNIPGSSGQRKIDYIIRRGGGIPPTSYCAFFVTMCIDSARVKTPTIRTGLARCFKLKNSIPAKDVMIGKTKVPAGTIIIWQNGNTIHGHTGFVWNWNKQSGQTIEGNSTGIVNGIKYNGIWFHQFASIQPANYFRITAFTLVSY